jgi:shikimate dehydrogenase
VLGSPIGHSLSPVLHRAAYRELGLDWEYTAVEVDEAALPGFLSRLDGSWRGLSLTMPLKRAVLPLLDELGERAVVAGAANTVLLAGGRRTGDNTDVPGAVAALRDRYDGPCTSAVVLGGGATAASTVLALAELGCREVTVGVRDTGRAGETLAAVARHRAAPDVSVLTLEAVAASTLLADVLVSTIPAAAQPPLLGLVDRVGVVFEVVYDPWPTPLARAAAEAGRLLVSGLDLLVHQAALQVELMTGAEQAPLEAMRAAGEAALRERLPG